MASLTNVHIHAKGKYDKTVITISGDIQWKPGEASTILHIHLWGEDGGLRGADDNLKEISGTIVSGGRDKVEEKYFSIDFIPIKERMTRFSCSIANQPVKDFSFRLFNEDTPGIDEIYGMVSLKGKDGSVIDGPLRTKTVSGWF